jgi:hypothetical protein
MVQIIFIIIIIMIHSNNEYLILYIISKTSTYL